MIIYKDMFSGDEICTDAYKRILFTGTDAPLNNVLLRFKATYTKESESGDYDIGANPSQEEQEEQSEGSVKTGMDIVLKQNLVETDFKKKSEYGAHLKDFMKRLVKENKVKYDDKNETARNKEARFGDLLKDNWDDTQSDLQKTCTEAAKYLLGKFKDLQFYTGESLHGEAMIIPLLCDDEGKTAEVFYWRQGVIEEKQ